MVRRQGAGLLLHLAADTLLHLPDVASLSHARFRYEQGHQSAISFRYTGLANVLTLLQRFFQRLGPDIFAARQHDQ